MKLYSAIRYTVPVLLAALVLFGAASCRGGETIEVESELELKMEGLAFNRQHIAVPAGESVTLRIQNVDTYPHYFAVYATEAAEELLVEKIEVPAHSIKEYRFTAPEEPGRYHFRDDYYPSKMNGVFIVSEEDEVRVSGD
jgi:plastocyanin